MAGLDDLFGSSAGGGRDVEDMLAEVQKMQQDMAQSAQRMAVETTDARSEDQLVRIWVNAQGTVIKAELDASQLADASAEQVAAAVVEAAQAAAGQMHQKTQAYQAELWKQVGNLAAPDGAPITGIDEFAALQPTVPLSPPGSRERQLLEERNQGQSVHESEDSEHWTPTVRDQ